MLCEIVKYHGKRFSALFLASLKFGRIYVFWKIVWIICFSNFRALEIIIITADLQGSIRGEWNWPISCLNYSETQVTEVTEGDFRELKSQTICPGNMPQTPQETYAFWAGLGNRLAFVLDLCLCKQFQSCSKPL